MISTNLGLESFPQMHLPGAHGHVSHRFPSLLSSKPSHLLGTRGRQKFSILLPNTPITSNTLRSSCTNCISPRTIQTAELFQYSFKCLSCSCNHCTTPSSSLQRSAGTQTLCTTANGFLSQWYFVFKEGLFLKKKIKKKNQWEIQFGFRLYLGLFPQYSDSTSASNFCYLAHFMARSRNLYTVLGERSAFSLQ